MHSGTVHWEMSVDGMTAAHASALEGHLECLAFLLGSAGCSALTRDRAANTPLHYGMKQGNSWGMTGMKRRRKPLLTLFYFQQSHKYKSQITIDIL